MVSRKVQGFKTSGSLEPSVMEMRADSLIAMLYHWELITVTTHKMLESGVRLISVHLALKETSGSKEAIALLDVWRSVTITHGEQCVMTYGD